MFETLSIDYFIDALDDLSLQCLLREKEPHTLNEAVSTAVRLETIVLSTRRSQETPRKQLRAVKVDETDDGQKSGSRRPSPKSTGKSTLANCGKPSPKKAQAAAVETDRALRGQLQRQHDEICQLHEMVDHLSQAGTPPKAHQSPLPGQIAYNQRCYYVSSPTPGSSPVLGYQQVHYPTQSMPAMPIQTGNGIPPQHPTPMSASPVQQYGPSARGHSACYLASSTPIATAVPEMANVNSMSPQLRQAPCYSSASSPNATSTAESRNFSRDSPIVCYSCNTPGHIQRFCPARRSRLNANAGPYQPRPPMQSRAASNEFGKEKVYIRVRFNGTPRRCLLDTGSETCLIPTSMVKGCRILPTNQKISAANGTDIPLLGYTTVPAKIGKQRIEVMGFVTEHIDMPYLGIDFLTHYDAKWDFAKREVTIAGVSHPLLSRGSSQAWIRRIVLNDDVTIPPMSQMNVGTKVIFGSPSGERQLCDQRNDDKNVWATEEHEVARGVLVARTILPDRASEVPVQLFNVTDRPVALKSRAVLGNLEHLHAYSAQSPSPPRQPAPADVENQIVNEMMNKVDPSVPDEYKIKFRQLLLRNLAAFSKNELDLGFTDLVMHRIDTGDARPVRQQLRRYPPAHLDIIDQHLQDMQRQRIIEPCQSP